MTQDSGRRPPEKVTFASVLQSFWRGLSSNLGLKLLSLLFALLIWGILISSDASLTREKIFTDVEVTVSGADTLRQRGFIVLEDVSALIPTVNFTAEVPQTSYDRATGSSFGPRIDLTRIRSLGEQEIPVTMTSNSFGTVTSIDPPSVTVTVEQYRTRTRIPITIEMVGTMPEGLWADTPKSDPSSVTVGGPEPLLQQVVRGVAQLDASMLTGKTQVERNAVPFSLLNADGEPLDASLLTVTYEGVILDSVTAEVNTYPTKYLPVDTQSAVTGELPEGYRVESIEIEPAEIRVAATKTVLETLEQAFVETPLDISGLTGSVTAPSKLKRITDAKNMSVEEVTITVNIVEATRTRTIRSVPIEMRNLNEALYYARLATTKSDVVIIGPYHTVSAVTAADIVLWVDASEWQDDERVLTVHCELENAPGVEAVPTVETVRMYRTNR